MNAFYHYDLSTGLFTGTLVRSSNPTEEFIAINTPQGCGLMKGVTDHLSQRVDPKSGELVDYIPPSPGDEYEWNAATRRWQLKREIAEQQQRATLAQAQIEALELASLRPLREVRLAELSGRAAPEIAVARLQEIEARCEALRADLLPAPELSVARIETGDRP